MRRDISRWIISLQASDPVYPFGRNGALCLRERMYIGQSGRPALGPVGNWRSSCGTGYPDPPTSRSKPIADRSDAEKLFSAFEPLRICDALMLTE